jgi:hypothetical protein
MVMLQPDEAEAKPREAWRIGHGVAFFVFMCLLVIVASFTLFGDLNLFRVIGEAGRRESGEAFPFAMSAGSLRPRSPAVKEPARSSLRLALGSGSRL